MQDVFIGLWQRGGQLTITTSMKSYLIKSAKTAVMKYYRDKVKREDVFTDYDLREVPGFDEKAAQHNLAIDKFLEQDLQRIVNQLPDQCQKVYRLSREEHLTTNAIATRLNISQKTVKNHLTKALSLIRSKIDYPMGS